MKFALDNNTAFLTEFAVWADAAIRNQLGAPRAARLSSRLTVNTNMEDAQAQVGRVYEFENSNGDGQHVVRTFTLYVDEVSGEDDPYVPFAIMYQVFTDDVESLVELISYRHALEQQVGEAEAARHLDLAANRLINPLLAFLFEGRVENLAEHGFELVSDDVVEPEEMDEIDLIKAMVPHEGANGKPSAADLLRAKNLSLSFHILGLVAIVDHVEPVLMRRLSEEAFSVEQAYEAYEAGDLDAGELTEKLESAHGSFGEAVEKVLKDLADTNPEELTKVNNAITRLQFDAMEATKNAIDNGTKISIRPYLEKQRA